MNNMPKYKLVSIASSGSQLLFVITGNRKKVFIDTGCLSKFYGWEYETTEKIIVTDQENMDIFHNLPKTKVYPMNPETFLILDQKFFWKIIMMPGTELSQAFCERLLSRSGSLNCSVVDEEFPDWQYHIIPTQHPIDIVHYRIKRKGSYLIGINIGEEEHVTKKIPYTFLDDLMKHISKQIDVKFVLFGTRYNHLRLDMIRRDSNVSIISMVEDFDCHLMVQAISMCDCFISLNRFLLHLSLAIGQDTIGLFYNNEFLGNEENENMIPNLYPYSITNNCDECNDDMECEFIYKMDRHCLDDFSIADISSTALSILASKDIK